MFYLYMLQGYYSIKYIQNTCYHSVPQHCTEIELYIFTITDQLNECCRMMSQETLTDVRKG